MGDPIICSHACWPRCSVNHALFMYLLIYLFIHTGDSRGAKKRTSGRWRHSGRGGLEREHHARALAAGRHTSQWLQGLRGPRGEQELHPVQTRLPHLVQPAALLPCIPAIRFHYHGNQPSTFYKHGRLRATQKCCVLIGIGHPPRCSRVVFVRGGLISLHGWHVSAGCMHACMLVHGSVCGRRSAAGQPSGCCAQPCNAVACDT